MSHLLSLTAEFADHPVLVVPLMDGYSTGLRRYVQLLFDMRESQTISHGLLIAALPMFTPSESADPLLSRTLRWPLSALVPQESWRSSDCAATSMRGMGRDVAVGATHPVVDSTSLRV
jgi:hypothetical protein